MWQAWKAKTGGSPEEFLADLQLEQGIPWVQAVRYAALVIALRMGELRPIGVAGQLQLIKQNLNRRSHPDHERFWTALFTRTTSVTVVTTNYDILAERGLRCEVRPNVPRPGFNYGSGPEELEGRGGFSTGLLPIAAQGTVPLLKLHGSVSWSQAPGRILKFSDCRPAIRGDAYLVAPVRSKTVPALLQPIWDLARAKIQEADRVIAIGYSLPEYDVQVIDLLRNSRSECEFQVVDPDLDMASKYERILNRKTAQFQGIPTGVEEVFEAW